ncbi:hypothetical protein HK101_011758, partial [Irineochytrium annulatum]
MSLDNVAGSLGDVEQRPTFATPPSGTPSPPSTPLGTSPSNGTGLSLNRTRLGRLSELQDKRHNAASVAVDEEADAAVDADDLLIGRSGKKGSKLKQSSRKGGPAGTGSLPRQIISPFSTIAGDTSKEEHVEAEPVEQSPLYQTAATERPPPVADPVHSAPSEETERLKAPVTLANLRRENGASWFKMYEDLKKQERSARDAATAADSAAVAAIEAARRASEAALAAQRGFSPPPLPKGDDVEPPSKRANSPGFDDSPPKPGHIGAIGPYRRVYEYGARSSTSSQGDKEPIRSKSGPTPPGGENVTNSVPIHSGSRSIQVTYAPANGLKSALKVGSSDYAMNGQRERKISG